MDSLNKMSLKRDSFGEPGNSTEHFWAAVGQREAVFREHRDGLEKECEHHTQPCSQAPACWTESKKGEGSCFYLGQSLDLEALSYSPNAEHHPAFAVSSTAAPCGKSWNILLLKWWMAAQCGMRWGMERKVHLLCPSQGFVCIGGGEDAITAEVLLKVLNQTVEMRSCLSLLFKFHCPYSQDSSFVWWWAALHSLKHALLW